MVLCALAKCGQIVLPPAPSGARRPNAADRKCAANRVSQTESTAISKNEKPTLFTPLTQRLAKNSTRPTQTKNGPPAPSVDYFEQLFSEAPVTGYARRPLVREALPLTSPVKPAYCPVDCPPKGANFS